jgi:hypothetical protein
MAALRVIGLRYGYLCRLRSGQWTVTALCILFVLFPGLRSLVLMMWPRSRFVVNVVSDDEQGVTWKYLVTGIGFERICLLKKSCQIGCLNRVAVAIEYLTLRL